VVREERFGQDPEQPRMALVYDRGKLIRVELFDLEGFEVPRVPLFSADPPPGASGSAAGEPRMEGRP
jgi:hypothetical protein